MDKKTIQISNSYDKIAAAIERRCEQNTCCILYTVYA